MLFSGCSIFRQPQSQTQIVATANDVQRSNDAQRINQYFSRVNPTQTKIVDSGKSAPLVKISIAQAIDKYVPSDFQIFVEPDVNMKAMITYNPNQPWADSFGKSLSDISVELSANLYKRTMTLRAFQTTLADVIESHIPGSYRVFTDPEIDVTKPIRFDTSIYWIEALSKAGADAGIDVTANLSKKIIFLKPMTTTNKQN